MHICKIKGSDLTAVDYTGADVDTLYEIVSQDIPVVVWVAISMTDRGETGRLVYTFRRICGLGTYDHGAVLIGYTQDTVTIADPISGKMEYSREDFERVFASREEINVSFTIPKNVDCQCSYSMMEKPACRKHAGFFKRPYDIYKSKQGSYLAYFVRICKTISYSKYHILVFERHKQLFRVTQYDGKVTGFFGRQQFTQVLPPLLQVLYYSSDQAYRKYE